MINNLESIIKAPEYVILYGLQAALNWVRQDFSDQTDETKSFLYRAMYNVGVQRYEFFTQAKKVIISEEDDARKLEIDLMFNPKRNGAPTVHITLPAEQSAQNTLGLEESEGTFQETEDDAHDGSKTKQNVYSAKYTRRYMATYNIVITGDNANEVVMLYHFFKALILSLQTHFTLAGLYNIRVGGQDLNLYEEVIPKNLYIRAISMSLEYASSSYDFRYVPVITTFMLGTVTIDNPIPN